MQERRPRPLLQELELSAFRREVVEPLATPTCELIDDDSWGRLHLHYQLLRRWLTTVALIGRGTFAEAPSLHYSESLAALPALPHGACLDFGSGAGFPGLALAACRPHQDFLLLESRQRKAAFLRQAAATMGLDRCRVVAVRWRRDGPESAPEAESLERFRPFAALTARAVDMAPWGPSLERILDADAIWLAWGKGATPARSQVWNTVEGFDFSGARSLAAYRRD